MNPPTIIRRFVFRELLVTTLLSTLVLTGILLYGNALRSHERLFQALALSPYLFLELIGFLVPYSLTYGLPFGFALAVLFCFGRWSSDKEILALRSLGLGIWDWGKPVFLLSVLLSVFTLYANLEWAPANRAKFDRKKEEVLWSNLHAVLEKEGEIEFNVGKDLNEESGKSLRSLAGGNLSKVSISVGEVGEKEWSKLRILLFGEDDELQSIVHAKRGIVKRSKEDARLVLDLRDIDVESGDTESDAKNWSSDLYVSFESWTQPLVLDLSAKAEPQNLKRMGLKDLWAFSSSNSTGNRQKRMEAQALLHKNSALGTSPFFLSFILLPLAILKGRNESVGNMALGVFVAVAYFGLGSLLTNLFANQFIACLSWWVPNLVCLILGLFLILRFEKT